MLCGGAILYERSGSTKRRLKRGLYQADTGQQINADVNGALQIIKKVVPNAFADGIAGIGLCPVKWSLRF